jgi:hypothetical protein
MRKKYGDAIHFMACYIPGFAHYGDGYKDVSGYGVICLMKVDIQGSE